VAITLLLSAADAFSGTAETAAAAAVASLLKRVVSDALPHCTEILSALVVNRTGAPEIVVRKSVDPLSPVSVARHIPRASMRRPLGSTLEMFAPTMALAASVHTANTEVIPSLNLA